MAVGFNYYNTAQNIQDPLFKDTFSWQATGLNTWIDAYLIDDEKVEALIQPITINQFKVTVNNAEYALTVEVVQDSKLSLIVNDTHYSGWVEKDQGSVFVYSEQGVACFKKFEWNAPDLNKAGHKGQLTAPMPSTVVAVLKKVGEQVKAGDSLIVLEAMKMEHTIHAPRDGTLSAIFYTLGSHVSEGAELLTLTD